MSRENDIDNIDRICRLCTQSGALIPIFGGAENAPLGDRAMSFARIQIRPGDGLPDRVCRECSSQLDTSYRFKVQCEESDKWLRSLLNMKSTERNQNKHDGFKLKIEHVSDNEDDKNKLNDDSVHSYTPLTDVDDQFTVDDAIFNSIKRSLSTEERSGGEIKTERGDVEKSRVSIETNRDETLKDKNGENENTKNNNIGRYNHARLKPPPESDYMKNGDKSNSDDADVINDKKIILCHLCGEITDNCKCSSALNNKNHKIRPDLCYRKYMCDICGRTYRHINVLKQHLNTHRNVKRFICDTCGKKFTRHPHVVAHMRIHNNIKPFVCEKCGRSFTKSSDLCRHKLIHSDAKNYPCPVCGRRFKRSGDIATHMRTHTGIKPYSCPKCDKSYTSHSSLKKHKMKHCKSKIKLYEDDEVKSKIE